MQATKFCIDCKESKGLDQFYTDRKRPDGKYPYCKSCNKIRSSVKDNERKKKWRLDNPERFKQTQRRSALKTKYGLTELDFQEMFEEQDGLCKICSALPSAKGLLVDHDHETGFVRGLLCVKCNSVLGFVGDDIDVLRSAIYYLLDSAQNQIEFDIERLDIYENK